MKSIEAFLIKLRIFDLDGTLSLTSLALLVMLYRVATCEEISMAELGAFLAAVANYAGKRVVNTMAVGNDTSEVLADLGTQVQALKTNVQVIENRTQVRR